jgi:esterase/lipase superfamily enzyme
MPNGHPTFWMVTNRDQIGGGFGLLHAPMKFWTSTGGPLDDLTSWTNVSHDDFVQELQIVANSFPLILDLERHQEQKHITLFVHGYSVNWKEAVRTYARIHQNLFAGPDGLGVCVLFNWPSDGLVTNYLPDRIDARLSAPDLALLLSELYDVLLVRQREGALDPSKSCHAKVSLIAHSMGNFVLQKAAEQLWTRNNQPLLVSLLNQLVMVAADVDNDLFKSGESVDKSDGDALANLTYRITALCSKRDAVLGLSAGLKHFGKRRLGRTGLDDRNETPDNVWDLECSKLFPPEEILIHTGYLKNDKIYEIIRPILQGVDRTLVEEKAKQIEFP